MAKLVGTDESVVESKDKSLETLQPDSDFVTINGEDVYIRPFTFGKLLKALKHLSNLASGFNGDDAVEQNLLAALADNPDDVLGLLCLSTGKTKEFFEDLDSGLGLELAVKTYKVNESFFVQTLLPRLQELFPSDSPNQSEEVEAPAPKVKKATGSQSSKN